MVNRAALLLLLCAAAAVAADGDAPRSGEGIIGPGDVPVVDVEANVRKMLEGAHSQPPGSAPAAAPEIAQPTVPRKGPKSAPAVPSGPDAEDYVPLPEETITVRSLSDVETVDRQLKDARKRNGTAPPGQAAPAP